MSHPDSGRAPGYLTIYSADRSEIYGEFADAALAVEDLPDGGKNRVFTGTAGEGTADTFSRLNLEGIEHVSYDYTGPDGTESGQAILLRPTRAPAPGGATVSIEAIGPR